MENQVYIYLLELVMNGLMKNKDFKRETLFLFYETYSRLKINELLIPLLKLYSDIILAAYINFEEKWHYF